VYIHEQVQAFQAHGWPTLSVDAKKKEKIGNYANPGREYHKKGQPIAVKVYDFVDKTLGKAVPYGIYDMEQDRFAEVSHELLQESDVDIQGYFSRLVPLFVTDDLKQSGIPVTSEQIQVAVERLM